MIHYFKGEVNVSAEKRFCQHSRTIFSFITLRLAGFRAPTLLALTAALITVSSAFGQARKLAIRTQPVPSLVNGATMQIQPVIEVHDASDQLVTSSSALVEIEIASGTGGTIGGTTKVFAVNGVATFTNLTFTGVIGEAYSFRFKSEPVIAYDPFDYTADEPVTGNSGGSGWSGAWEGVHPNFTDLLVFSPGLSYTGFSTTGYCAGYVSSNGGDAGRTLNAASNSNHNVVWLAFLGNYSRQGGGFSNVRLLNGASTVTGGIGGNDNYAYWAILDNDLKATTFSSTEFDGNTHLALVKFDYTAETSSLWMDPVISTFDGTEPPSMTVAFAPVFDRIHLYNRYNDIATDEITLAATIRPRFILKRV